MANKFKVGEKVTRIEKKEGDIFYSSPPNIKVIEVDGDKFWGSGMTKMVRGSRGCSERVNLRKCKFIDEDKPGDYNSVDPIPRRSSWPR